MDTIVADSARVLKMGWPDAYRYSSSPGNSRHLKAYHGVSAARADIADHMGWYNAARAHSRLGDLTPDEHYLAHLPALALSA